MYAVKGRCTSTVTPEQEKIIKQMKRDGASIVAISKTVHLSRPTVYTVVNAK